MAKLSKRFSSDNTYSVKFGAKYISYTDNKNFNKNGSAKTTGYLPNTYENRKKITKLNGKPEKFGDRLIWW